MRWGLGPLLLVAGALNLLGYIAFAVRWWLRRAVRLIRTANERATLACRHEGYARRVAEAHGVAPRKVFWTG